MGMALGHTRAGNVARYRENVWMNDEVKMMS